MKPNLRVVTHLYLLAELSKAQKKNSLQTVVCVCSQPMIRMTTGRMGAVGRDTYDCATESRFDWYIFSRTFAAQLLCP